MHLIQREQHFIFLFTGLRLPGGDPAYFNIETAAVAAAVCSTNAIEGQTAL